MVQILYGRNSGNPQAGLVLLTIDATLSQEHVYRNKISSFPVEQGQDITDHVQQMQDELPIEGIISDTPDGVDATVGTWAQSAYKALCTIAGRNYVRSENAVIANEYPDPLLVDVLTEHRVFTNMVIESLKFSFVPTTGSTVSFNATFKNIRKVSTSSANVNYTSSTKSPGGSDRAAAPVDAGKKQVEEVKPTLSQAIQTELSAILGLF